jgi:LPXTG-motif cell wall-anchored protein
MKKFALALMAASALVFGFGAVAQAQYGSASATFNVSSATPGQSITVTITGCTPGETLTITVNGVAVTATCSASALTQGSVLGLGLVQQTATSATATITAPTTPGTYPVVITGSRGFSFTTSLTVVAATTPPVTTPGGGLPATGSSGISTTTGIAIGLLVVGAGLFVVAQVRRRQPNLA